MNAVLQIQLQRGQPSAYLPSYHAGYPMALIRCCLHFVPSMFHMPVQRTSSYHAVKPCLPDVGSIPLSLSLSLSHWPPPSFVRQLDRCSFSSLVLFFFSPPRFLSAPGNVSPRLESIREVPGETSLLVIPLFSVDLFSLLLIR